MAGGYEKAITIESAIRSIAERRYLLPSIQRKFTWDMDQVCRLFDSIMRHYPINSLMLWKVDSAEVRAGFRFYEFLTKYAERYAEDNPDFDTKGHGEFYAVIDGQQRLTSLYIGLKGHLRGEEAPVVVAQGVRPRCPAAEEAPSQPCRRPRP
ncbi:DUF262 domain-containing protein [Aestuariimicrobium sp. T2.26MG-19.2B]|uniref:DUF262 domain-containing protein n=1 Tax=Aestuariimicrobium sp. T2.26MG-19.2B TaxID=3040679 RepID=UPI0024779C17|nr:DUF262 domain-containing protein [Aestuariimicrobium sp. T2.26MG-19.2B]CAI9402682.1 hypothetical protein AESSP_00850 [Aestuariimicrobium sp. T2.26MG-19.2B]